MNKYSPYLKYFGHFLSLVSIAIIFKILYENIDKIEHIEFSYQNILIFLFLIIWGLIGYSLFAYTWIVQLKHKYSEFTYLMSLKIIATTQINKYLPGNIGHFIGRYYMSKKYISKLDFTYTLLIENIIFVIASCIIGSIYIYFFDISKLLKEINFIYVLMSLSALFLLALLFIVFLKKNIGFINLNFKIILKLIILFCIISTFGGLSIYIIFNVINTSSNINLLLCISAFSLSFLIGFIVPGAPGGIGIREYTFTLLFSPFVEAVYAMETIIIFRIISVCTDLALYIIGKNIKINTEGIK